MNPFLHTDVYKMGHMEQYPEGITKIYSYLTTRSQKRFHSVLFFGLQGLLRKYFWAGPQLEDIEEFLQYRYKILGQPLRPDVEARLRRLPELGYWPLRIKAVPEGSIVGIRNVLMTVTNTHPDYAFLVGFFESLLLKVWNTCTVATHSKLYKNLVDRMAEQTCDDKAHVPFAVHDFGYRGCSSEETAELSGSAHLVNFLGTDTVLAVKYLDDYYTYDTDVGPIGLSVPASEHCVMCVYGREGEFDAFERMLELYPTGIVSIVSDTYNLWNVLEDFVPRLKNKILRRDGKVVFRPDSGDPVKIICGNPSGQTQAEKDGCLRTLAKQFGTTVNTKGYRLLHPQVGLIYGDGMYYQRYAQMLDTMEQLGYASSNLVIGVGGIMMQQASRDDLGFAFKATYCEINGKGYNILKDPITDSSKRSHCGLLSLRRAAGGGYETKEQVSWLEEEAGELRQVYYDGNFSGVQTIRNIRERAAAPAFV